MKTKSLLNLTAFILMIIVAWFGVSLATPKSAPIDSINLDDIVIANKTYERDRKGPVKFSHVKHARDYNVSCWDCHHNFKEKMNKWKPWEGETKCTECHSPQKTVKQPPNLHKAFHFNCRGCHKAMEKKEVKTGPFRKCYGCHEKRVKTRVNKRS